VDIEHFGFLSSVFRKAESHEQDGERLRGAPSVRDNTASGDPAMALRASIRLARTDIPSGSVGGRFLSMIFSENRYPLFGIMLRPPRNSGLTSPPTARADQPRATNLNGEC
jgi:hypothetical protein